MSGRFDGVYPFLYLQGSNPRNSVSTGVTRDLAKYQSGNCDGLVNAMHITASVFINDDESDMAYVDRPG